MLDAFRTYVFDSSVTGVQDGLKVQAHTVQKQPEGNFTETRFTGCAGGFGGGMMDGSVKNSAVSNLATVEGLNYTGGFVGHLGKSGVADIDDVGVLQKLLTGTVGALDLFGSHVDNCAVTGFGLGTVVEAKGGEQPIAGGFAGYADLAKINDCSTTALKQVTSGKIAGGFIGRTDMNYVVTAELQSRLLNIVFVIVDKLLHYLYIGKLQDVGLIDVNLGPILKLQVMSEGNTLYVELLGLKIGVALNKKAGPNQSDLAIITIGDSVIELPCTEQGVDKNNISNVKINLIKGNRTDIDKCSVTGISAGYDVFAGGAGNDADGKDADGYSGGFIGLNHEGQVKNSTMTLCDVVRGTDDYGTSNPSITTTRTYPVKVQKHAFEDNNADSFLAGAKFALSTSATVPTFTKGEDGNYTLNNADTNTDVVRLVGSDATYRVAEKNDEAGAVTYFTTVSTSATTINGLKAGTYYLHEIEAPEGYNKLTAPVKVTITETTGADGKVTGVTYKVGETDQSTNETVKVENKTGSMLPSTGGMGTIGLTALGVGVVALGVLAPKKKKEKQ